MITFDDFKKVEITVGKILSVEKVPETDKLLKLSVDFGLKQNPPTLQKAVLLTEAVHLSHPKTDAQGLAKLQVFASHPLEKGEQERDIRQIISGIALYFPDIQTLVGKKCMFVTNLEPRVIRGLESNGMLLAVSTDLPAGALAQAGNGKFSILEPSADIPEGTRAK